MRDHTYNPFFIISGETKETDRTNELHKDLQEYGERFTEIQGVYKGTPEKAFIVFTSDTKKPLELREKYNQESVLVRSCFNDVSLVYADHSEHIGSFKEVPKNIALSKDSYSIIDGNYYITE